MMDRVTLSEKTASRMSRARPDPVTPRMLMTCDVVTSAAGPMPVMEQARCWMS